MKYQATSTKERYEELLKNRLLFSKYDTVNIPDDTGFLHTTEAWTSCDATVHLLIYAKDLPADQLKRKLFIIEKQLTPNGQIDGKKQGKDTVNFEIREFNKDMADDWCLIFNDCLYNYKSGNNRHCHMSLFWALYVMTWEKKVLSEAFSKTSAETLRIVTSYISNNIVFLSLDKQKVIVELLKGSHPNLQPLVIPDIENTLKELSPTKNFNELGFYEKVDYILNFGSKPEENAQLQKLYRTSRNRYVFFKFWMENTGRAFYDYNVLETIFSFVGPLMQLKIVKRYLHDVRLKLTEADFALLEHFRDCRSQAFIDIRYFITTPGDNIDLVAPMFCDAILTLKKSEGKKVQDFNGILDFAISHSNKAYPSIDLGIRHFLPTCDGGLMHNSSFLGFIHFSVIYTFDETQLTEDRLKQTVAYLLRKFAVQQYHYCCANNNDRELSEEEKEKCSKVIRHLTNRIKDEKRVLEIGKCESLSYQPINPYQWKTSSAASIQVLSLFIDNIESKDYITYEDVNFKKLKESLLAWGKRYKSFRFWNGNMPEYVRKKEVASHIAQQYYSPTSMIVYPNDCIYYSDKKSLLGAWDEGSVSPNQKAEDLALASEPPIVYQKTFEALKNLYPQAEVEKDCIKLPYDAKELSKIKAFFYYRHYEYTPEKGYDGIQNWSKKFLSPRKIQGVFYCTPKVSESREKVSNLPFFWCRSDECFYNMLGEQTLDKQNDWKKYTLYHASEIIGYKLIDVTDKGNIPVEAVSNFAGEVRQAERLYARLVCRSCGHMIFSTRGTILNGSRFFSCANSQCPQYKKEIYLSQCNTCKKGLIDSRDSQRCENGWVICPSCLSCCNDNLFDQLIERHRRNGRVPQKLLDSQNLGHNNKGIFFCPKCGTQISNITVEEKQKGEDGVEVVVKKTIKGCPQCKVSYENELEKHHQHIVQPDE